MRVVTYITQEDAPFGKRAVALIFHGHEVHPVTIFGENETAARLKAETWWEREVAKARKPDRRAKRPAIEVEEAI